MQCIILGTAISIPETIADDKKTVSEKVEKGYEKSKDAVAETYDDAKKETKKAYREVKDKTCEMVNGKMVNGKR